MYDLIIQGGRVVSPADGLDTCTDIGIKDGRIAAIGSLAGKAYDAPPNVVDARGKVVTAGFIDFHVHGFAYFTDYGTYPDDVGVKSGVTTVVDQGSAGYLTFPAFKKFMVDESRTQVFSFLNIGAVGTIKGSMLPALHSPATVDVAQVVHTVEQYPEIIRGIKTHAEMGGVALWGFEVLALAKQASREAKVPCYVHTGKLIPAPSTAWPDPDTVMPQAVTFLDPGDILTHCFTGHPGGILHSQGFVHPAVREALAAGVLLDVGYGEHFSFRVAETVLNQGVRPHIVSSDVHALFNRPHSLQATYGLAQAMSHLMALGFSLTELVEMVTNRPAAILRIDDRVGHIRIGYDADLTIFSITEGEYTFRDRWGDVRSGTRLIRPEAVVRQGHASSIESLAMESMV